MVTIPQISPGSNLLRENTPVESYLVGKTEVFVKREDLCVMDPEAPPFSKLRGLYAHLKDLKRNGINTVGYAESAISMAGWGVAWLCSKLDMKCYIFDPQYKTDKFPPELDIHRGYWDKFGAERIPVPAGRTKINYYRSRKWMTENLRNERWVMLPIGLVLEETIHETYKEFDRTLNFTQMEFKSIVVNVGSGTICSGLLRSYRRGAVHGVLQRSCNVKKKRKQIIEKAGNQIIFDGIHRPIYLLDPLYEYTQRIDYPCPFPTNDYYDLKAWKWLCENIKVLDQPILFWNIGSKVKG